MRKDGNDIDPIIENYLSQVEDEMKGKNMQSFLEEEFIKDEIDLMLQSKITASNPLNSFSPFKAKRWIDQVSQLKEIWLKPGFKLTIWVSILVILVGLMIWLGFKSSLV